MASGSGSASPSRTASSAAWGGRPLRARPNGRKPVGAGGAVTLLHRDPPQTEWSRSAADQPGHRGDPRGCRIDPRCGCVPVSAAGRGQRGQRRVRRAGLGPAAATVATGSPHGATVTNGSRPRCHRWRGARGGARHSYPATDLAEGSASGCGATGSRAGQRPGAASVGPAGARRNDRGRGRGDQRRTGGGWLPGVAGR